MFRRFVSGSAIASVGIAIAALITLLVHGLAEQRFYPLTMMWCIAPLVWGLWAMLAPSGWVPERLPIWGAVLGLVAGMMAFFVLNLPLRVLGVTGAGGLRGVGVVVIVVFYYVLWMLVRLAFRSLSTAKSVE
jgi:drug/metabolite transporter (DMT)-like permease